MRITIIYDNEVWKGDLKADWGFSCFVELDDKKILFDTGANGSILLHNMKKLNISPATIKEVFISHDHWDHIDGLPALIEINKELKVYIPFSCSKPPGAREVSVIKDPVEIHENIFSTGELGHVEHSMAIKTEKGMVVIAGCSHPGVGPILNAVSLFGKPYALIGGLHGFRKFDLIESLELICPTHCTQFKSEIQSLYPQKIVNGGAGKVIEIS